MIGLGRRFDPRSRAAQVPAGERIYVIADIHGRLDLFGRLIREIESDHRARSDCCARIVVLGDFIDRGPQSADLVRLLREMAAGSDRFVVLCGNHEALALDCAAGSPEALNFWLGYGGDATLQSYGLDGEQLRGADAFTLARTMRDAMGEDVLDWLRSLPASYRAGDYFFCHAGVRPGIPLARQARKDLLWIRRDFLDSDACHGAVIVHGHSETDEIEMRPNRINLDTAAYRSGRLTAMGLEGAERWFLSTGP